MAATWRLVSRASGKTVVARLQIADGFWSRLVGLQFRRALPPDAALLLVPCHSVHTCFVRFPLDVAFLDRHGAVLAIRRNLRPWRLFPCMRNSKSNSRICFCMTLTKAACFLRLPFV